MNKYIIGADGVGEGSLAGEATYCGVRAPIDWSIPGLNDSKKLSAKKREELSAILLDSKKITYILIHKSNNEIDTLGLGVCLKQAYQEIADQLLTDDTTMIIDGLVKLTKPDSRVSSLIRADAQIPTVMAASIIAKVYRDALMQKLTVQYPEYGWDKNAGYGVPDHLAAIKRYGLCDLHRKSYKLKSLI